MKTDFVLDALEQALYVRQPHRAGGLIHHGDRGSQYVSIRYTERLAEAGIEPSVGSKGDSYDNALAETINGPYKAGFCFIGVVVFAIVHLVAVYRLTGCPLVLGKIS